MAKTAQNRRMENLASYEKLVATKPDVERKGDTMPYTSVNGHMFSLLTKDDGVILRFSSISPVSSQKDTRARIVSISNPSIRRIRRSTESM